MTRILIFIKDRNQRSNINKRRIKMAVIVKIMKESDL